MQMIKVVLKRAFDKKNKRKLANMRNRPKRPDYLTFFDLEIIRFLK